MAPLDVVVGTISETPNVSLDDCQKALRVIDEKAARLKIKALGYFIVPPRHNLLFGPRKVIPVQFGRDNVVVTWYCLPLAVKVIEDTPTPEKSQDKIDTLSERGPHYLTAERLLDGSDVRPSWKI